MVSILYDGTWLELGAILWTTLVSIVSDCETPKVTDTFEDWSIEQLVKHHDRELRGLGNLYSRLHAPNMCDVDRTALPSASSENPLESQLVDSLISLSGEVVGHMDELAIGRALESILSRIDLVSRRVVFPDPLITVNPR